MLQNKKENFDSHFINNSFQTPLIRNKIDEITTGNTIKHILASDVKNIVINMPSFKEQKLISQLFKLLDLNITLHQCKLEKLKLTKKALLQKLFPKNGKHIPEIRFKGFTDAWEQCKLGEFVNIVSGDAPSTFISGNCIYVKVDDLNYSDRIQLSSSNLVNANPKAHLVNTGATIFPKRGATIMTNKVRIMGQDGYLDTNMMALIPKEIDKDFLFTFIQKTGLYKISDTSTIPQINNKHIEPYMIQVPTNKEQECIGVFFEKIDKIITLHQRKLERLQEVKKGLLQKMFV
ncbi:MAG: restriction endonuclease subunit S [Veillonella atypica]|uniref:restriction endonuclease subunit S n=1 Tax=Veillonella atypica TaxID=39777 RepID=UPI0039947B5A